MVLDYDDDLHRDHTSFLPSYNDLTFSFPIRENFPYCLLNARMNHPLRLHPTLPSPYYSKQKGEAMCTKEKYQCLTTGGEGRCAVAGSCIHPHRIQRSAGKGDRHCVHVREGRSSNLFVRGVCLILPPLFRVGCGWTSRDVCVRVCVIAYPFLFDILTACGLCRGMAWRFVCRGWVLVCLLCFTLLWVFITRTDDCSACVCFSLTR